MISSPSVSAFLEEALTLLGSDLRKVLCCIADDVPGALGVESELPTPKPGTIFAFVVEAEPRWTGVVAIGSATACAFTEYAVALGGSNVAEA